MAIIDKIFSDCFDLISVYSYSIVDNE